MKIRLRHKIISLAILSALVPVLILLLMILSQQDKILKRFDDDFKVLVDKDITDNLTNIWNMCHVVNEIIQQKVYANTKVAQHLIQDWGPVCLADEKIAWRAENQNTKEFYFYELPKLTVGQYVIEQNFNESVPTAIVDDIHFLTRETVSIFQRVNEEGDMIRTATTLLKADGSRDIAQFLEANNKEMDPDLSIHKVLQGEIALSSVNVLDQWYIVGSAPIKENYSGKVIGMVRTATNEDSLVNLQRVLAEMSSKTNGFLWVLKGHAKKDSNIFLYPKISEKNYMELNQLIQDKGMYFFENIRRNAISGPLGQIFTQVFEAQDTRANQMVLVKYVYFPKWDWIIGILGSEKDYAFIHKKLRNPFEFLVQAIIWAVIIGISIVILVAFFLGEKIVTPLSDLNEIVKTVASGNLSGAADMTYKSSVLNSLDTSLSLRDETSHLFESMGNMIEGLNTLLLQVKKNTSELVSCIYSLKDTSVNHKDVMGDFNDLMQSVSNGIDKISNTSLQLYQTMCGLSEMTLHSSKIVDEGKVQTQNLESNLENLTKLTEIISNRLITIKQRINSINSTISTLSKVADQADVLAVNSAIEAEKLGEYGKGLNIISRQIGQLADQTTAATNDAHYLSNEMHNMISDTMGEMEHFNQAVYSSINDLNLLSYSLHKIIEQVHILSPKFDFIKNGMEAQYQETGELGQAISQIHLASKQNKKTLIEFTESRSTLEKIIKDLSGEVSHFNVLDPKAKENRRIITEASYIDLN